MIINHDMDAIDGNDYNGSDYNTDGCDDTKDNDNDNDCMMTDLQEWR